MDIETLSSSSILSTFRCCDPDAVTGRLPGTTRRVLPLAGAFDFLQAELRLGDLRLVVVKRPPCASEGYLDPSEIGIALSLKDSSGLKVDGLSTERPTLVTHGLSIPHRIFQPSELTIAAVFVPESNGARGWPERAGAARIDLIDAEALAQLRATVRDVIRLASRDPQRFDRESVVSGMRQSILGGIDHAFLTAPGAERRGAAIGNYVRICARADEYVRSHAKRLPSSAVIAEATGVTIRTLHNAMVAVHGMSLQRLMILSRLWSVRAALLEADPNDLVKTIAFDHGFWHMGRFSSAYRAFFHETPSQTLDQARSAKRIYA